jgi:hypothetical protein
MDHMAVQARARSSTERPPRYPRYTDTKGSTHGDKNVEHGHFGLCLFQERNGFSAISRFGDHFDVARFRQEFTDAFAHHGVIVGQEHTDRFGGHVSSDLFVTLIVPHQLPVARGGLMLGVRMRRRAGDVCQLTGDHSGLMLMAPSFWKCLEHT